MSNIISELTDLVGSDVISKAAGEFGESESGISSIIGSLAPTILGGMLNQSSNPSAFGKIFDMIGGQQDSGIMGNLGSLIGGGASSGIAGTLMSSLFGNKVGGIIDLVSSVAGVKKSSSNGILGMVAPLILSYLGKKVMSGGISGLTSLLSGQRSNINAALPQGMGDLIGFSADAPKMNIPKVTKPDVEFKTPTPSGGGGGGLFKYLIPILLLAGAIFAYKSCGDDVKNVAGDAMETVGDVAGDAADMAGNAAGAVADAAGDAAGAVADAAGSAVDAAGNAISGLGDFFSRKLANGFELNIPEFGIESKFIDFVEGSDAISNDAWYNFDRLTFTTGSANVDMAKSKEQLDNIVNIMKAYPKVNVKLGGYTDNTGNEAANLRLSQARSDNVKAAIVAAGIDGSRIETEGYGIAHPVASNDTEEGRAQNRRIALRVTAK